MSTVKALREKGVKPREEAKERLKEQRKITKKILDCLKSGPKTIPEISSETGLPPPIVTWYVMTLRKYGTITEVELDGDYYKYGLMEDSKG